MNFDASDIYDLHQPKSCDLRPRLAKKLTLGPEEPSLFTQLLRSRGEQHEQKHLRTLGTYTDLSAGDFGTRHAATITSVQRKDGVIYQPVLNGRRSNDFIIGIPDLLIKDGDEYLIRDCKLARSAGASHPEITRQLNLYGWLFRQEFGVAPLRLEAFLGDGSLVSVYDDGGAEALADLDQIRNTVELSEDPYEPVGWSKCEGCRFSEYCWNKAHQVQDVALIIGVNQEIARDLRTRGMSNYVELLEPNAFKQLKTIKGIGTATANKIWNHARALRDQKITHMKQFPHTIDRNYVVLDLEGISTPLVQHETIYLWGMQVFGLSRGEYIASTARMHTIRTNGENSESEQIAADRAAWQDFLASAKTLFSQYGDLRFIHYSHYEGTSITKYIARYGDYEGIGARIHRSLLDLRPLIPETVTLPVHSYSLKVVEKQAGYERSQEEYGGLWSVAKYFEALDSQDPRVYDATLEQIRIYNREDLEATWAVFEWMAQEFGNVPSTS